MCGVWANFCSSNSSLPTRNWSVEHCWVDKGVGEEILVSFKRGSLSLSALKKEGWRVWVGSSAGRSRHSLFGSAVEIFLLSLSLPEGVNGRKREPERERERGRKRDPGRRTAIRRRKKREVFGCGRWLMQHWRQPLMIDDWKQGGREMSEQASEFLTKKERIGGGWMWI